MENRILSLEKALEKKKKDKFKCDKCDYVTGSTKGLKMHVRRKHTVIIKDNDKYPQVCDICEDELTSQNEMKKHMKQHSYIIAKFKCEDCDFVGENGESMNVHIGRTHSELYECGLCDMEFDSSEKIEIHLFTCETFHCEDCGRKEKTFTNIKEHNVKEHGGLRTLISHFKLDRQNYTQVCVKSYWTDDL